MFDFRQTATRAGLPALPLDPVSGQVDLASAEPVVTGTSSAPTCRERTSPAPNLEGSHLDDGFLPNANLTGADLRHADLRHADLTGVTWSNTICPDGSNSNSHGSTCLGHL